MHVDINYESHFLKYSGCYSRNLNYFSVPCSCHKLPTKLEEKLISWTNILLNLIQVLIYYLFSQNHRMAEVGRELWRSSGPIPLLEQGNLEPVAQDRVQMAFELLQERRLYNLSGQPVVVLSHPHSKKCFLMFRWTLLCVSLCSLPLVLSLGVTEKNLALSSLHPPFRHLYTLIGSFEPSLL